MSIALLALVLIQSTEVVETMVPTIVVTAKRAEEDLAACLARNCPPGEEVEAALDAAVQQFGDARYVDAKQNLSRTISRSRRHSGEMPELFASLLATFATVAQHEGDDRQFERTTFERARFLREHLGETSLEAIAADLDSGDMQVTLGRTRGAEAWYRRAQELAGRSGRQRVAAAILFRRAWLALGSQNFGAARRLGDEALALAGPGNTAIAEMVRILQIRIAFQRGDEEVVERSLAELRAIDRPAPMLVTAPRIRALGPPSSRTDRADVGTIRFMDLGFWVRPDGRTADIEVLRSDGDATLFNPVLRQVAERRYAPAPGEAGDPGVYQIERYTYRPSYGVQTGTRIVQRIGPYSLHVANLTHMSDELTQDVANPLR